MVYTYWVLQVMYQPYYQTCVRVTMNMKPPTNAVGHGSRLPRNVATLGKYKVNKGAPTFGVGAELFQLPSCRQVERKHGCSDHHQPRDQWCKKTYCGADRDGRGCQQDAIDHSIQQGIRQGFIQHVLVLGERHQQVPHRGGEEKCKGRIQHTAWAYVDVMCLYENVRKWPSMMHAGRRKLTGVHHTQHVMDDVTTQTNTCICLLVVGTYR